MMSPELKELTIEITQKCPNKCVYCSSLSNINAKHKLEHIDVLRIAKQALGLGLKKICISGGEPLYHPDIVGIINSISALGLEISLYTTGLCPTEYLTGAPYRDWENFIDKEKITPIFNIQSIREDIHDKITSNIGSFRKTKDALMRAKDMGFRIENHIVPNKLNIGSLEETVGVLTEWGVHKISFLRFVPQGYARDNLDLLLMNQEDLSILREKFNALASKDQKENKLRFGIPFSNEIDRPKRCNAADSKLIVRYDGIVLPCEAFKDIALSKFKLGDIWSYSLKELLHGGNIHSDLNDLKRHVCSMKSDETCVAQVLFQKMGRYENLPC